MPSPVLPVSDHKLQRWLFVPTRDECSGSAENGNSDQCNIRTLPLFPQINAAVRTFFAAASLSEAAHSHHRGSILTSSSLVVSPSRLRQPSCLLHKHSDAGRIPNRYRSSCCVESRRRIHPCLFLPFAAPS